MKLLFDHNLLPLLVSRLADLFPQSQHVFALGLDRASDFEIRDYPESGLMEIIMWIAVLSVFLYSLGLLLVYDK